MPVLIGGDAEPNNLPTGRNFGSRQDLHSITARASVGSMSVWEALGFLRVQRTGRDAGSQTTRVYDPDDGGGLPFRGIPEGDATGCVPGGDESRGAVGDRQPVGL